MMGVLVIDAGTTAFKAAVLDESLQVRGLASREFEVLRPATDRAEMDAEAYWSTCAETVRDALRNGALDSGQIAAVAITGHTDTLFALDAAGQAVANAILWSDPRAQAQAERIQREIGLDEIYRVTGQAGASYIHFASRIAWFRENEASLARRVHRFLQTQDYLIYRLSGEAALDHSIACCSLLARLEQPEYWPAMLSLIGVDAEQLSRIVAPGQIAGKLKSAVAESLGLPSRIPVIAAAMDATAATVAVHSVAPDSVTDTTGAALVIGVTCDGPTLDPNKQIPCFVHGLPGKYLLLPWCETAGAALRWYRDQFFATDGAHAASSSLYDRITAEAAEAPPGCGGIVLLPHFAGSGCPDFNPAAKACLYGLTLGHQRKHISRAFLESIAFLLKQNLDRLADMGVKLTGVTCAGGGSRSPVWCQIKADVTGLPVQVYPFPEVTARGAAMLALRSLGETPAARCSDSHGPVTTFQPNPAVREIYQEAFERFIWLNSRLQSPPASL